MSYGLLEFTIEQWQTLLNLMNLTEPKERLTGTFSWILDTAATHHVTCTFSHLRDVWKITSCPIGFSYGSSAEPTHEEDVLLPGNLKITNVLFVSNLDCNSISIP